MKPTPVHSLQGNKGRTRTTRSQRGAATLIVVMVLFFIISLVAAYTSRNLIFEQRTSNNQYRSTQALETAEAGLEWAISMLNFGRIDANCGASANTADFSFRQRYLNVASTGHITPSNVALMPACVSDGAGGWTCSCPAAPGALALVPASTTQVLPAFQVRFQVIPPDPSPFAPPRPPGLIRVQVVGCTRLDAGSGDQCMNFNGQGAFNEGRAVVTAMLALTGGASSPPQAALTARGNVAINGALYSAYNTGAASSGLTVHSGGTISTAAALVSSPGNPGGIASTIASDPAFDSTQVTRLGPISVGGSTVSTNDRMFAAIFNMRPEAMRTQQAIIELACPCSAADVRAKAALNPGRPIWVAGDLDINTAGPIGSAAEPVLLVVNGDLLFTVSGVNINGLVYTRTNTWASSGAGQINGATVAEGSVAGNTSATFVFDADLMQKLRWNTGSFVRVPSSWKDFQ